MTEVKTFIASPCPYNEIISGSNAVSVKPKNADVSGVSNTNALATMPAMTNTISS